MTIADSTCTVIIPTLCGSLRTQELRRSIDSALRQQGVKVDVLVVVNGSIFDPSLLDEINHITGVRVLQLAQPGISNARLQGRRNVLAEYFLMLDDDDELLPHAVRDMITTFERSPTNTGVVLGDAYNTGYVGRYNFVPSAHAIEAQPLESLLIQNWLILQSTLFKTAIVGPELFDVDTVSNECTLVAFKIALAGVGIRVHDAIVATVHYSPEVPSESKTERFLTQKSIALSTLLPLEMPSQIRRQLRKKIGAAHHDSSMYYLQRHLYGKAWRAHIASLLQPGGMGYLAYTRHLLMAPLNSR